MGRWRLDDLYQGGVESRAEVVIMATGILHHPRVPSFTGLSSFAGQAAHTAQWDPELDLDGKRVVVIGAGSTGIQMVAHLALEGRDVVHIQRSPQWIMPFPNREYTEEEKAEFRADIAAIDAVRYAPEFIYAVDRFANG